MITHNLVILGVTGSIGLNALKVLEQHSKRFKLVGVSGYRNISLLQDIVDKYKPEYVAVRDGAKLDFNPSRILYGNKGLIELVSLESVDLVLNALVGASGLMPSYYTLKNGLRLALANKESLVLAGSILMKLAVDNKAELIPVDSEHSAIHQCLKGESRSSIKKIILTASGGPFRDREQSSFSSITPEEALNHPNWNMGKRISIDSATLMNKGFEVIEAVHLFSMQPSQVEVVIHPQSIVHSMVEFKDNSILAQLGIPDMKLPIQYAMTYPDRLQSTTPECNLFEISRFDFFEPDTERFPCLRLALDAIKNGGFYPTVLNAADEIAVEAFIDKRISFDSIPLIVERTLEVFDNEGDLSIDNIIKVDDLSRLLAHEIVKDYEC
jgi:1-deoxy-D-xylulose-5-phosphate reductoisomerase